MSVALNIALTAFVIEATNLIAFPARYQPQQCIFSLCLSLLLFGLLSRLLIELLLHLDRGKSRENNERWKTLRLGNDSVFASVILKFDVDGELFAKRLFHGSHAQLRKDILIKGIGVGQSGGGLFVVFDVRSIDSSIIVHVMHGEAVLFTVSHSCFSSSDGDADEIESPDAANILDKDVFSKTLILEEDLSVDFIFLDE